MIRQRSVCVFLVLIAGVLACARPREAAAVEPVGPCLDVSGRWDGTWNDTGTGHHGPLHARITRIDDCRYRATFHGRFRKAIPFVYSVTFCVVGSAGDELILAGTHHSALTGRVYEFTARASACRFTAEFCSDKYRGVFELTRAR